MAAEEIIDMSNFSNAPSILDQLDALYEDNLIRKERQSSGRFRYSLFGFDEEFTSNKLSILDDVDNQGLNTEKRHARYYGKLFNSNKITTSGVGKLSVELDNFLIGLQKGNTVDAFACFEAAIEHFRSKGPIGRGVEICDHLGTRTDLSSKQRQTIILSKISCLNIIGRIDEARQEMRN